MPSSLPVAPPVATPSILPLATPHPSPCATWQVSDALEAMLSVPPLSVVPRATLTLLANRAERIELAPGAKLASTIDEAGDNFFLVVATGVLVLTPTHAPPATTSEAGLPEPEPMQAPTPTPTPPPPPRRTRDDSVDDGDTPPEPPPRRSRGAADSPQPLRSSALLSRFAPPAVGTSVTLAAHTCIACGRPGEEMLVASLFSAASPTDVPPLHLLQGDPTRWALQAAASGTSSPTVLYRVPLVAACATVRAAPTLPAAGPLPIRAILATLPLFSHLPNKDLDELSFAFSLMTIPSGQTVLSEGAPAPKLHIILSGKAELRRLRKPLAAQSSFGYLTATVRSSFARNSRGDADEHAPAAPATRRPVLLGEGHPGDVLGMRSVLGGESKEPVEVVAATDLLTLAIDRAVAPALLPLMVTTALLMRPDALKWRQAAADLGVPDSLDVSAIIARGGFGTVARATHSGKGAGGVHVGTGFAVKKVRKQLMESASLKSQMLNERASLAALSHPYVCRLYATHKNAINLYFVLELCDGPELYNVLHDGGACAGGMAERSVRLYAACVVSALAALHELAWLYRDVKTENLVFTSSGSLKLVDMGLARRLAYGARCYTVCGSCEYMAPELLDQRTGYDYAADWWGVGCLLYEMRFGHTPWVLGDDGRVDESLSENAVAKNITDHARPLAYPLPPAPADGENGDGDGAQAAAASKLPPPSEAFDSLLRGLLTRRHHARLGGRSAGASDIRAHAFFSEPVRGPGDGGVPPVNAAPIDWRAVDGGTLPMPPMPSAADATDAEDGGADALATVDEEEDDEEDEVDPITAQLMAFLKQKQAAEAAAAAESGDAPAPAPSLDPASSLASSRISTGSYIEAESDDESSREGSSRFSSTSNLNPPAAAPPPPPRPMLSKRLTEQSSCDSFFGGGSYTDINDASVAGFWDGPPWDEDGDAWDREF